MKLTDRDIGEELQRYIVEESHEESGKFIDDRFFQLSEENPELEHFTRHMIAIVDEDAQMSQPAKEICGRYLLIFATVLHNANKRAEAASEDT